QRQLEQQHHAGAFQDDARNSGAAVAPGAPVPQSNQSSELKPLSPASNAPPSAEPSGEAAVAMAQAPPAPQAAQKRPEAIELAGGKIRLGFTLYGDWGMYVNSGFGPQFLTQINQPGPGNDKFNSFDISRTYINFLYSHNDAITLRLTPNIYRQVASETALKFGQSSAVAASGNGNLTLRMKYAYVDFNKVFAGSPAFGKGVITIGQQMNPLI